MDNPNIKKGPLSPSGREGSLICDRGKRMAIPQSPKGRAWMHRA